MDTLHHCGIFLLPWEKSWNNTWHARVVDWYLCNCQWQWPWIQAPVTQDESRTTSSWSSCKKNYWNRTDALNRVPRTFRLTTFYTVWMNHLWRWVYDLTTRALTHMRETCAKVRWEAILKTQRVRYESAHIIEIAHWLALSSPWSFNISYFLNNTPAFSRRIDNADLKTERIHGSISFEIITGNLVDFNIILCS